MHEGVVPIYLGYVPVSILKTLSFPVSSTSSIIALTEKGRMVSFFGLKIFTIPVNYHTYVGSVKICKHLGHCTGIFKNINFDKNGCIRYCHSICNLKKKDREMEINSERGQERERIARESKCS